MAGRRPSDSGVIEAAGGLLWREGPAGPHLAIVHRERYNDWSLPKGWREPGETFAQAAGREVEEETGCRVQVQRYAGCTSYLLDETPKIVLFWHMRLLHEEPFVANEEIDALRWVTVEEALSTLSHAGERQVVRQTAGKRPTAG